MYRAFLVARREYLAYITAWGFWLGLLITPFALSLGVLLPSLIEQTQPVRYYAVIEDGNAFTSALELYEEDGLIEDARAIIRQQASFDPQMQEEVALQAFEDELASGADVVDALTVVAPMAAMALPAEDFLLVDPSARSLDDLRPYLSGDLMIDGPAGPRPLFAVFIMTGDAPVYWSEDVVNDSLASRGRRVLEHMARAETFEAAGVPLEILEQVRLNTPDLLVRSPTSVSQTGEVSFADQAPYFIAIGFSFLLWLLIFSVVNYLLTGTIEERSNKIFDSLLTSVSLPQLLTGKLLGVLMLSLTLISVWATLGTSFIILAQDTIPPDVAAGLSQITSPRLLVPTLISFLLGYLMFGSIFLALGSLCDTIQEAQSLLSPVIIIMMLPLLLLPVAISNPESTLLHWATWVPLLTPFLVIVRIPTEPPLWEVMAQIVWMFSFTALIIWAASKIYRAGAVHGAGMGEARNWFMGLFGRKPKPQN